MSSTRPYDEILNDWNDRLKAEPEWVQFEAEIMIQCSAQDGTPEEILVLAFIMQARASVLQGSMDKALELYNCALTRANNITFPQLPESLVWMQEAQEEYEDLWKLVHPHDGSFVMNVDQHKHSLTTEDGSLALMLQSSMSLHN